MEVGDGEDGCTKLVPGTGVPPVDGSGDMTCALSSEELEVETFAVWKPADHTISCWNYLHTFGTEVLDPNHSLLACCKIWLAYNTGGDYSFAASVDCTDGCTEIYL